MTTTHVSLEDLLHDLGGLGKFQVVLYLVVQMGDIGGTISLFMMQFSWVTPGFYCRLGNSTTGSATTGSSTTGSSTTGSSTTGSSVNGSDDDRINACHVNDTTSSCSSYDFTGSMKTVVTEWSLVCDDSFGKQVIISVQMAGVAVGVLVSGHVCKAFGRKITLYSAQVFMMAMDLIAAFSVSWVMFAILRVFLGLGYGVYCVPSYLFTVEFVPGKYRCLDIFRPFQVIGAALFAIAAYVLKDWFYLQIFNVLIALPAVLIGVYFVPESVRWLTINGRLDESMMTLERIARMNQRPLPSDARDILQRILLTKTQMIESGRRASFRDLFRNTPMIRQSVVSWLVMFSIAMAKNGLAFGVSNLVGNLYINIFLFQLVVFIPHFKTLYTLIRYGRKPTLVSCLTMAALGALTCLLARSFDSSRNEDIDLAITVVTLAVVMFLSASMESFFIWASEMNPSVIRSLGLSWAQSGAGVGMVAAPFLVNLDSAPDVAYGVISALLGLSALGCLLLPETRGKPLASTCPPEKGTSGN